MVVETALKVVSEVAKQTLKESVKIIENEFKDKTIEMGKEKVRKGLNNAHKIDFSNPPDYMKDYKLFKEFEVAKKNPDTQMAVFNKLISEKSNMIGQKGECFAYDNAKNTFGGEINSQFASGANRLDMLIRDTNQNAKIKTLRINDGIITVENSYIPKNSSVALEIKNGSVDYLRNEINSNHALDQVMEGKRIADHSLLCIRQDVAQSLIEKQDMVKELQKIQECGGKIAIFLPSDVKQNSIVMEALR